MAGVAHTARDALRHLDREPVELVLPDLPGLDVVRALRAHGHAADVIAVTSVHDLEMVRSAVSLGVAQYVLKPFAFPTLRDRLVAYAAYRAEVQGADEATPRPRSTRCSRSCGPPRASTVPKGLTEDLVDSGRGGWATAARAWGARRSPTPGPDHGHPVRRCGLTGSRAAPRADRVAPWRS